MSQILSHLSTDDLKTARLVSRIWNQESSKWIKKREDVVIKFDLDTALGQDLGRFAGYSREMMEPCSRFVKTVALNLRTTTIIDLTEVVDINLTMAAVEVDLTREENLENLDKLSQDLVLFFNPQNNNHNFTRLVLGGDVTSPFLFDTGMKIMNILRDSLLELELRGVWRPLNEHTNQIIKDPTPGLNQTYCVPLDLKFTRLRKFTLSMDAKHGIRNWDWVQGFLKSLEVFYCYYF